jgi:hypothetical protein
MYLNGAHVDIVIQRPGRTQAVSVDTVPGLVRLTDGQTGVNGGECIAKYEGLCGDKQSGDPEVS